MKETMIVFVLGQSSSYLACSDIETNDTKLQTKCMSCVYIREIYILITCSNECIRGTRIHGNNPR